MCYQKFITFLENVTLSWCYYYFTKSETSNVAYQTWLVYELVVVGWVYYMGLKPLIHKFGTGLSERKT